MVCSTRIIGLVVAVYFAWECNRVLVWHLKSQYHTSLLTTSLQQLTNFLLKWKVIIFTWYLFKTCAMLCEMKAIQHIYRANSYAVWLTFWPKRKKSMSWIEKTQAISMISTIKFIQQALWNIYSSKVEKGQSKIRCMAKIELCRTAWLASQSSIPLSIHANAIVYFRCFAQFCLRQFFKWHSKTEEESGSVCERERETEKIRESYICVTPKWPISLALD